MFPASVTSVEVRVAEGGVWLDRVGRATRGLQPNHVRCTHLILWPEEALKYFENKSVML